MELIGKPTINPFLFYTGKIIGYSTWVYFVYSTFNKHFKSFSDLNLNHIIAIVTLAAGLIFSVVSMLNLGKSTRLGLPSGDTELKTGGIYKISRNPMYVGFNLFTITAMIFTLNIFISIMGIYSIIVYHLIIKNEEKFLISRFGADYEKYMKKVRRYIFL